MNDVMLELKLNIATDCLPAYEQQQQPDGCVNLSYLYVIRGSFRDPIRKYYYYVQQCPLLIKYTYL